MTAGDEGVLTLSIGVRVSPEPVAIELLHRYRDALNYAIKKIIDNNFRTLKQIHIFCIEILLRDLIFHLE